MKKMIFSLLALFAVAVLIKCESSGDLTNTSEQIWARINKYEANGNVEVFRNVHVKTTPTSGNYFVLLYEEGREKISKILRLQAEDNHAFDARNFEKANIVYGKKYFAILPDEEQGVNSPVIFTLNDSEVYKNIFYNLKKGNVIKGYGVAKIDNEEGLIEESDFTQAENWQNLSNCPSVCASGGCGATSCKFQGKIDVISSGAEISCEVSCASNYYSCCGQKPSKATLYSVCGCFSSSCCDGGPKEPY
jgi:hypothetical protein